MARKGHIRERSTRAVVRDKLPVRELARRRKLLKDEFVENCQVYLDERSKLKKVKGKVPSYYR